MTLQEKDSFIASKTKASIDGGLNVILCCGESLEVSGWRNMLGAVGLRKGR